MPEMKDILYHWHHHAWQQQQALLIIKLIMAVSHKIAAESVKGKDDRMLIKFYLQTQKFFKEFSKTATDAPIVSID